MKRTFYLMIVGLLLFGAMQAQVKLTEVRAGFMVPEGSDTGFIGGLEWRNRVDDLVSYGFSTDFFYSSYTDDRKISTESDGGVDVQQVTRTSDMSVYYLPLMTKLRLDFPARIPFKPFATAGVGWGFLWEDTYVAAETTPEGTTPKVDDIKLYHGFNWIIGAGVTYPLGTRSNLIGEIFYNGGAMTRNREETEAGITWDEVSMNGFGLRLGIELRI